jgi:hypothetical protein
VLVALHDWGHETRVVLLTRERGAVDVLGAGFDGRLAQPVGGE